MFKFRYIRANGDRLLFRAHNEACAREMLACVMDEAELFGELLYL